MELDKVKEAKRVFDVEIDALKKVRNIIGDEFIKILDAILSCQGRVIITGMGKSGHIAGKMAATLASLGTPAFCLHPAEALHGDLGAVTEKDLVIVLSHSGESDEITRILPNLKMIGAKVIAISGNVESTLVKYSDIVQIMPEMEEACFLHLAPTSTTTAALVYGDALAVVASRIYGFTEYNFGLFHPAGALGRKLVLKVSDIMKTGEDIPLVYETASFKDAIIELSKKGQGMVVVIDYNKDIRGIITDGDLRRQLEKGVDVYKLTVSEIMVKTPIVIRDDELAVSALRIMREKNISNIPVLDIHGKVGGTLTINVLLNAGIV